MRLRGYRLVGRCDVAWISGLGRIWARPSDHSSLLNENGSKNVSGRVEAYAAWAAPSFSCGAFSPFSFASGSPFLAAAFSISEFTSPPIRTAVPVK